MANILLSTGFSSADIKGCKSADGFSVLAQMPNGDSITLNLNNPEAEKLKSILNMYEFKQNPQPSPQFAKKRLR